MDTIRKWSAGAVILGIATMPTLALAHESGQGFQGHHGMGMMWDGFGGAWFMGPLMMLLFLVLAVVAVAAVVRWGGGHGPHQHAQPSASRNAAREILEQRFARGEIDEEEFRRRRQALDEAE
mgnify:CR=1 FL=1